MRAKDFIKERDKLEHRVEAIRHKINSLYESVTIPDVADLRRATAKDVVVGNVFYYHPSTKHAFWQIIRDVRWPDDDFKAYVAEDGCRYGLDDAWVENG